MTNDRALTMAVGGIRSLPVGRWRLFGLYVRARGMLTSMLLVLGSCGLLWLLKDWASENAIRQALVMQAVPVLIAALSGVSAWSPFVESERTSARSLPALRGAHIGTMLVMGIGVSVWFVHRWDSLAPAVALDLVVARNIMGFAGVAMVFGRLVDARLSWIAPLAMGIVASIYVLSAGPSDFELMWGPEFWNWSGQSSDAMSSWIIALVLGLGGLGWMCWSGVRDASGEEA